MPAERQGRRGESRAGRKVQQKIYRPSRLAVKGKGEKARQERTVPAAMPGLANPIRSKDKAAHGFPAVPRRRCNGGGQGKVVRSDK